MLLNARVEPGDVPRQLGVCTVTINRLWVRYNNTLSTRDGPKSGRSRATAPAQDRYIWLKRLRGRFRTATSTTSQIPGLRQISSQTVISRLHQATLYD